MNKIPVLVTGGAGYIGSHAVLALRDAGWPVVVIDNLVTGFRWAVPDDVTFLEGNISDSALVEATIREHGIGAILHFAGSVVVPESVENPLKYYDNNTANSRSLISSAIAAGVKHFIFSSTAATYGIPDEVPVREDMPTIPINPYGMSKLMTEYMLRDVAAAHDFNFCALRYFNVAGADPDGRSGQSTVGATHLIKVAVEAALGRRSHVAIFGDDFDTPDGTGVRDYIHVSDLAGAHVLALEYLMAEPQKSHILNCGYGRGFSVREVLDTVDRVTNSPITRQMEGRRAGDPDMLISDNSAIRSRFGWQPRYDDLEQIVRDALQWERILAERGIA
jgi:UDP-glucose 4-epimerase